MGAQTDRSSASLDHYGEWMKMHRGFLTLVLTSTLIFSDALQAQLQDRPPDQLRTLSRDELDIVKVLTGQENAWNRADLDGFATAYKNAPDTLFIGQQVSRGYAQMLSDYHHNYPNRDSMGTLAFSELETHLLDDRFAVLLGRYHLDRNKKAGGPADGLFSLVLEKTNKGWKIIVDHRT